ncbi:unnamed protein product [Spirodela intermedia]|uniref:Uncharacterized protein n=1 Tax=Spirodela intermedia TaxID=51605 RepID=A0ABN7EB45_SPIIN|nr:unnamed protein product [Spirodela intermedia]
MSSSGAETTSIPRRRRWGRSRAGPSGAPVAGSRTGKRRAPGRIGVTGRSGTGGTRRRRRGGRGRRRRRT